MTRHRIFCRSAAALLVLTAAAVATEPAFAQGYGWNHGMRLGWGARYAMRYDVSPGYYGVGAPVYGAYAYGYSPYAFRTAYGCLPYNRHCPW